MRESRTNFMSRILSVQPSNCTEQKIHIYEFQIHGRNANRTMRPFYIAAIRIRMYGCNFFSSFPIAQK